MNQFNEQVYQPHSNVEMGLMATDIIGNIYFDGDMIYATVNRELNTNQKYLMECK